MKSLKKAVTRAIVPLGAAAICWIVLFGLVAFGLRIPSQERIHALSRAGRLDYSQILGKRFGELSGAFISRILGFDLGSRTGLDRASDSRSARSIGGGGVRTFVTHPLNNDDFVDAYAIPSIPFTAKTTTTNARRQSQEPQGCSPTGGTTVWYRYRPSTSGFLVATTFGSDHATALAVFSGSSLTELKEIDCDFDPIGAAQVVFKAEANQSIYFQVAAPTGGGSLVFNLDPTGRTRRVSVSSSGVEGNGDSIAVSLSADGRYVAFYSRAGNLVQGDNFKCPPYPDSCSDVFVHDTVTGRTEMVSVSSDGKAGNGISEGQPAISGDGRYVAFGSMASNLVSDDTNHQWDIFVHDRVTHTTERVSVDSEERQGKYPIDYPTNTNNPCCQIPSISISSDGRFVAFASDFPNLVTNDNNACFDPGAADGIGGSVPHEEPPLRTPGESVAYRCRDVFVRDRVAGTTTRVSVSSAGQEGNGDSASAFISPNGRFVAFSSDAENLDPIDRNGYRDAFVHDRLTGETELVSLSSLGKQGQNNSGGINERNDTTVSDNGRFVAFISYAEFGDEELGGGQHAYLRDRRLGTTTRLPSPLIGGPAASGATWLHAAMSADGRFVAGTGVLSSTRVESEDPEGPRRSRPILLFDRLSGKTTIVSVSSSGEEGDDDSFLPDISADGSVVGFYGHARNLVEGDRNNKLDVFVHELPWAR